MGYRHLLFDADNTLLDFDACEAGALERLFREMGLPWSRESAAVYHTANEALWRALERGELTQQELLDTRFAVAFRKLGLEADGKKAEARYRELLGEGAFLMPGAVEVCRELAEGHSLWIVTNGVSNTQRSRLARSGLDRWFQGIFVSGEMGVQKPQPEYFDRVMEALGRPDPREVLLIGDSLTSDIRGGVQAGLPTCWYNPRGKENDTPWKPDYEIRELREIPKLPGVSQERKAAL
jgi:2-haloacid dehalogenase